VPEMNPVEGSGGYYRIADRKKFGDIAVNFHGDKGKGKREL
jgi:hypothetical protein